MDTLVWLLALYARYFAAVFAVATVALGLLWLASLRARSRTSPGTTGAQISAPRGTEGA